MRGRTLTYCTIFALLGVLFFSSCKTSKLPNQDDFNYKTGKAGKFKGDYKKKELRGKGVKSRGTGVSSNSGQTFASKKQKKQFLKGRTKETAGNNKGQSYNPKTKGVQSRGNSSTGSDTRGFRNRKEQRRYFRSLDRGLSKGEKLAFKDSRKGVQSRSTGVNPYPGTTFKSRKAQRRYYANLGSASSKGKKLAYTQKKTGVRSRGTGVVPYPGRTFKTKEDRKRFFGSSSRRQLASNKTRRLKGRGNPGSFYAGKANKKIYSGNLRSSDLKTVGVQTRETGVNPYPGRIFRTKKEKDQYYYTLNRRNARSKKILSIKGGRNPGRFYFNNKPQKDGKLLTVRGWKTREAKQKYLSLKAHKGLNSYAGDIRKYKPFFSFLDPNKRKQRKIGRYQGSVQYVSIAGKRRSYALKAKRQRDWNGWGTQNFLSALVDRIFKKEDLTAEAKKPPKKPKYDSKENEIWYK